MSYDDGKKDPEPRRPPRPVDIASDLKAGIGAQMETDQPREVHPREFIMQIISRKCEDHIDQITMLRRMRAQVQFMGRSEADLLLQAIRSAECTGLLRW